MPVLGYSGVLLPPPLQKDENSMAGPFGRTRRRQNSDGDAPPEGVSPSATPRVGQTETEAGSTRGGGFVGFLKRLRRRFGLDKHRLMERFMVTTAVFLASLVAITGSAVAVAMVKHVNQLSSQSMYTTTFTSSRSGISGKVAGLERSADGTRAVIWTQIPNMNSMSADAATYRVYVTGGTLDGQVTATALRLAGQYAVYGSTGVMAIVLDSIDAAGNPVPFGSELLAVTVRANREIVTANEPDTASSTVNGESFEKFDQWRLFENPGASETSVDPSLAGAGAKFDAASFYRHHVVAPRIQEMRKATQDQLALLKVDLARITEYTQRAKAAQYGTLKLVVGRPPAIVDGDRVDGAAGSLVLTSSQVVTGGYSFALRSDDTPDGYAQMTTSTEAVTPPAQWQRETTWLLTNDKLLSELRSDKGADGMRTAVADLEAAWSQYYNNKRAYQVDVLGQVVDLAVASGAVEQAVSLNSFAVKVY